MLLSSFDYSSADGEQDSSHNLVSLFASVGIFELLSVETGFKNELAKM